MLASRAAATAASSFGSVGLLVLPVANMGVLLDGPAWLAAYPALFALSLIGTTAGLAAAIGLFLALDPRRARTYAQLCAALVGGAFLLGAQIAAMLPEGMRTAIADRVAGSQAAALLDVALLGWLSAIAVLVFAGAVMLLSGSFLRASLRAAGGSVGTDARRSGRRHFSQFGSGLGRTLRRKEWRLLRRDHSVFAQLSLQIIYTVPLAVVLLRGVDNIPLALAIAPAIVVIAAQISASLAWITVSGEDAPELIAAAPVLRERVELAKVTAIGLPVLVDPGAAAGRAGAALSVRGADGGAVRRRGRHIDRPAQPVAPDARQPARHAAPPLAVQAHGAAGAPDGDAVGDRDRARRGPLGVGAAADRAGERRALLLQPAAPQALAARLEPLRQAFRRSCAVN